MNDSHISVRYAKALFQGASDQNIIDRVYKDMDLILDVCRVKEFRYLLDTPAMSAEKKIILVKKVLNNKVDKLTNGLIELVIKNKRESYLPGIARNYKTIYKRTKGIKTVTLVTASAVEEISRQRIEKLIKKAFKAEIDISVRIDDQIIGGFMLTVEDLRYDASVSTSLKNIEKELLEATVVKK